VAGDEEGGVDAIERAIVLNPNLAWAWLFSGWAKIRRGEFEAAIERVTRAMRLSPNDPHVFSMQIAMAAAHFGAERYAEALAWAERAMSHREDLMQAMLTATASAALIGETAKSTKLLERLRAANPALRLTNLNDYRLPLREDRASKQMENGLRKAGLPE
jgi:tetratricopeptide (TPR) repeat protein